MTELALAFDLGFADLYDPAGLARVDQAFLAHLAAADGALCDRQKAGRAQPEALASKAESDLLIDLAPHVEDFLGALFGIRRELCALAARHHELAPLYACKRLFIQRRAAKAVKPEEAAGLDGAVLT